MSNGWIGNYAYFRARLDATRIAVTDLDTGIDYTYGELESRANRLAHCLAARFNVGKGDRVAIISRNRVEMLDAYYAVGAGADGADYVGRAQGAVL